MTSSGIRYSNMLPLHDVSAVAPSATVSERPRRNQCSAFASPLAIATKLATPRRAAGALPVAAVDPFGVEQGEETTVVHRRVGDRETSLRERDQMPREIPRVHRGDVRRVEHAQIAEIVPVEEVAADARHA